MLFLAAALVAGLVSQPVPHDSVPVPLYSDLGDHHHAITTANPRAQQYFDQGLRLVYGFNHPEAIRSFREAQRLDPSCAMCVWGEALAFGPNINVPMDSASGAAAYAAIRRAAALAPRATPREQAYIRALAARYGTDPRAKRQALDSAYARAMGELVRRYPGDDDAAVLLAEAQMLLGPWDYWTEDKTPKAHGAATLTALEPILARSPKHAGACHFFIHAVEAAYPERAVPCAERLPELMPGAGHVVHMPAHIYIRVGRYADAIDRNVHALHADEPYLKDMAPDGVYRLALHPHNGHFLSFAASMIGRSAQAMESARLTKAKVDPAMMRAPGLGALQHYYVLPIFTMIRFAQWDDVLAEPAFPDDLPYPEAVRRFGRALTFATRGEPAAADAELAVLRRLRADERVEGVTIWDLNAATTLLDIAIAVASGEIAVARGDLDGAIAHFRRAVAIEDGLTYDEPPPWHQPVRQQLGRALLKAKRAQEAEVVFRRDLERHPENGWSLHGLAAALEARAERAAAAEVRQRFARAWATADIALGPDGMPARVRSSTGQWPHHEHGATAHAVGDITLPDGVRLRYVEMGDPAAAPVILLHGYGDSWFSFSRVLPGLAGRHRVIALDLRGHGHSDAPADGYRLRELAADVVAFMNARGIARASLVGHSLGSFVAQHVAASWPDRVDRLVLLGSAPTIDNGTMRELAATVRAFQDSVTWDFAREFQLSTMSRAVPDDFLSAVIAISTKMPLHAWKGVADGFTAPGAAAALRRIKSPTLVLSGEEDAVFSAAEQKALVAAVRGARYLPYVGTGHAPHWEEPLRVVRDVTSFLAERSVSTR